jgi:dihydrofolate synthase / folylpolyglutamate synthase
VGEFQRRNFALARAAAEAYLGELDMTALAAAAAEVRVPGRLQQVDDAPLTLLDGAHNPDGMRALVQSLPGLVAGHDRLIATLSILDDKDAAGMLAALMPACDALVLTACHNPRALPPPTLASLARQLSGPPSEIVPDPERALARARELAGPRGVVIATGSLYLIADLLAAGRDRSASVL